ncbi:MAG: sigma-70 family RNA polymerase sigma factor [Myxococcota bacterium]
MSFDHDLLSHDGDAPEAVDAREPLADRATLLDLEDALFRYARRRVASDEIARDLVQETWLAGLSSIDRFAGRASLKTWLTAILRRKIADVYRGRKPTTSLADVENVLTTANDPFTAQLDARRRTERVLEALPKLTPREREAVELCGLEDLAREEAADIMGLSRPCLRVTLCRGRKRLREAVDVAA